MQWTVAQNVFVSGIGLHSGQKVSLTIKAAPRDYGLVFCRTDVTSCDNLVPADLDHVVASEYRTEIANPDGVSVSTIEHLMAALATHRVSNARIEIGGAEVPAVDGSAKPFSDALIAAGFRPNGGDAKAIRIVKGMEVGRGADASAALEPLDEQAFEMDFHIRFDDEAIGEQDLAMRLTSSSIQTELLPARTFVTAGHVEKVRALGLGRGGSVKNAVVVENNRVWNREGLRFPDEFVRHKMLDAIGDLSLCGYPIIGKFVGRRSGHYLTVELCRKLMKNRDAWMWENAPNDRHAVRVEARRGLALAAG